MESPIQVYIKTNIFDEVTDIGSSIFIKNTKDWILIDEGYGDKYAHAQSQYLENSLMDSQGRYNYVYKNGSIQLNSNEVF